MKVRPATTLYWKITLLVAIAMLLDGIGGVMRAEAGKEVMLHLGYPEYVLSIFGVAKLLGAMALVQTTFHTIKEWAYAGFTFNFLGAFASRAFVGDELSLLLPPLIALGIMLFSYFLWKKHEQRKSAHPTSMTLTTSENFSSQAA
jgi:hypothetical protein